MEIVSVYIHYKAYMTTIKSIPNDKLILSLNSGMWWNAVLHYNYLKHAYMFTHINAGNLQFICQTYKIITHFRIN